MPGMQSAEVSHRTASLPADTDGIVGGSRLLGEMRDLIRRKHDSIRTEQAYLGWAKRYILFHGIPARDPRSGKTRRHHLGESSIQRQANAIQPWS